MTMPKIRSYTELSRLRTIEERFDYLRLHGSVGNSTFGFDRYMNQQFYTSSEWRRLRNHIIARDNGCDLGIEGYEVYDRIAIHHMNPMRVDDIVQGNADILDPEFLIAVAHQTHNAIHYGTGSLLPRKPIERRRGDTKLW
jgi:hypothetical protein